MNPIKAAIPGTTGLDLGAPEVRKIQQPRPDASPKAGEKAKTAGSVPFADFLDERLKPSKVETPQELKFSAHAQSRLQSRGIDLTPEDLLKMQEAVNKARDKGSRESLVLTDKAAFVVSVKNNTVITAVDRESLKDNVFTNIDSTVMI
jgi:flagellar operon protein